MFRLRLTLIYLGLTIAGVLAVLSMLSSTQEKADKRLVNEITRSQSVLAKFNSARQLQLGAMANRVASSRVKTILDVLRRNRKEMHRIQQEVFQRFGGKDDEEKRREALINEYDDVHRAIARSVVDGLKRVESEPFASAQQQDVFVDSLARAFARCQAKSVKACTYEMMRQNLVLVGQRLERDEKWSRPAILIVADDRFVGLADFKRKNYAFDTKFSEDFSLVRHTQTGQIRHDITTLKSDWYKGVYFVAAAPIFGSQGEFLGVVLVGQELNSSMLLAEKRALGRDVTYLRNKQVLKSTIDSERLLKALHLAALPVDSENPQLANLQTDELIAQFIPLTGNWSERNVQVAVSARRQATGELEDLTLLIPFIFTFLFVVGVALFMWVVHLHHKPVLEIDSGIHEVISGNRDHVFNDKYRSALWSEMAQALNRMVGELVGREMVDEDGFDEWAKSYLNSVQEASKRNADPAEADEVYYARIFEDYQSISAKHGVEGLSYADFIAKISRTESALLKRLGWESVRIEVHDGPRGPVLKPIKSGNEGKTNNA